MPKTMTINELLGLSDQAPAVDWDEKIALSIALSMKRIADSLEISIRLQETIAGYLESIEMDVRPGRR